MKTQRRIDPNWLMPELPDCPEHINWLCGAIIQMIKYRSLDLQKDWEELHKLWIDWAQNKSPQSFILGITYTDTEIVELVDEAREWILNNFIRY